MQQRLIELQLQRGRLLERIAHQRLTLTEQAAPVARTLHLRNRLAQMASDGKQFAVDHPLLVAAAVGTVVVLRPGTVLRWTRRGFLTWRTWTALRSVLPTTLSRWL